MGRSTYNFDKRSKEKARQQKQLDKAAKRLMAKQNKAGITSSTPREDATAAEPEQADDIVKNAAQAAEMQ
jgi:hypothetical protein